MRATLARSPARRPATPTRDQAHGALVHRARTQRLQLAGHELADEAVQPRLAVRGAESNQPLGTMTTVSGYPNRTSQSSRRACSVDPAGVRYMNSTWRGGAPANSQTPRTNVEIMTSLDGV
jgi:hypothetical protein